MKNKQRAGKVKQEDWTLSPAFFSGARRRKMMVNFFFPCDYNEILFCTSQNCRGVNSHEGQ